LYMNSRRGIWLAWSVGLLFLLAACSSAVSGPGVEGPAVDTPVPGSPDAVTAGAPATPDANEGPVPAATGTDAVPESEEGILTEDDRPARLKSITAAWNTNWNRRTIEYGELLSGGPPRDGIPSIDEPQFVSAEEAAGWLADNEPVIALEIDEDARAYPLQILTWHEIVNDVVGDVPVIVTFCPLCNAAITFDRRLEGQVYEFGTSGLLRNSDLVMYDRTTESLWQQLTGEAIVGDMVGKRLRFVPSSLVSFEGFRQAYPRGNVLSRDTGYSRDYGRNPYAGYDRADQTPFLFDGELDGRLLPMERVVTISFGGVDVAYPLSLLSDVHVVEDAQAGVDLVVWHVPGTSSALDTATIAQGEDVGATGVFDPTLDGRKLSFRFEDGAFVDKETGSTWNVLGQAVDGPLAGERLIPIVHGNHFWFAWAAFKPDTIIYQTEP
ncbi:MAG: DUF3179 domain-containing protein, partial [Anaerolineae bacterium]|nr:DUF3179 domain-containing protein [Anaerolineae bacterium]